MHLYQGLPGVRHGIGLLRRLIALLVGRKLTRALLPMFMATCSPVQAAADPGLLEIRQLDRRLAVISFRLATRNAEICAVRQMWPGMTVHVLSEYGPQFRIAAAKTFQLQGDYPAVLAIVPGGPADTAGLREDETIAAINDQPIATAALPSRASIGSINAVLSRIDEALWLGPVRLSVNDGGARRTIIVRGIPGCKSRIALQPGSKLDARADGENIEVTGALAHFVRNDDELAIIAAHEMAHNILRHRDFLDGKKRVAGQRTMRGGKTAQIRATEVEADYLGLYLAARAGYDITLAPDFWERFGRRTSWGIFNSPTHPGWRRRQEAAIAAIAEISGLKAAGMPVLPMPGHFEHCSLGDSGIICP